MTTSRSARADVSVSMTVAASPVSSSASSPGIGDRRGGEQELWLGVVDPRQPPQAPQDVRDVRAEHAAIHVRLVGDDIAQVREDVSPAVVVREDADVEHVRVREHDVRRLADLPPSFGGRSAS